MNLPLINDKQQLDSIVCNLMNPNLGYHIIDNFCPSDIALYGAQEAQVKYIFGEMSSGKLAKVETPPSQFVHERSDSIEAPEIRSDVISWVQHDQNNHPFISQIMQNMDLFISLISQNP